MTRLYTGKGDDGTTGLLFGGRVPKDSVHPRAVGAVDEAQAVIGVARSLCEPGGELDHQLTQACRDLWVLMGELATLPENHHKLTDGQTRVSAAMVGAVAAMVDDLGARFEAPANFVVPGQTPLAAQLDVARTVVRRAEREAVAATADGSARARLPEPPVVVAVGPGPVGRGRAPAQPRRPGRQRPTICRVSAAMDLGLAGRTAAVAGASSGLGLASARALAAEGVRVAICGRDRGAVEAAAAGIDGAVPLVADVSTIAGATGFVEAATEALDRVDILVPNAGGPPPGTFASTPLEAYLPALELNLLSTVAMCRAAVPPMCERGWGRVVAITSMSVRQPIPSLILSNTARSASPPS